MIQEGRHKSTYRMLSDLMNDSLSITQMYMSSRETRKINQILGDTDLGFWMCPFSVAVHIQYTRITILVAHPLKNYSSCHICCLPPHQAITCGTTRITAEDACHFGFAPKFNYSRSDKIPLRMHHIPHCVLQQTVYDKKCMRWKTEDGKYSLAG